MVGGGGDFSMILYISWWSDLTPFHQGPQEDSPREMQDAEG